MLRLIPLDTAYLRVPARGSSFHSRSVGSAILSLSVVAGDHEAGREVLHAAVLAALIAATASTTAGRSSGSWKRQ